MTCQSLFDRYLSTSVDMVASHLAVTVIVLVGVFGYSTTKELGKEFFLGGRFADTYGELKQNNDIFKDQKKFAEKHQDGSDHEIVKLDSLVKHLDDPKSNNSSPCISAFNRTLCVDILPEKSKKEQWHTIEYHKADGNVEKHSDVVRDYTFATVNKEKRSHAAFLRGPRGIMGHMQLKRNLYTVFPLPHNLKSDEGDHVIYSKSGANVLDEIDDSLDVPDMKEDILKKPPGVGYHYVEEEKYQMELMLAADYTMVEFYGEDVLKGYLVAFANIIHGIYHDPSLEIPIDVKLVQIHMFEKDVFHAASITDLLRNFTVWSSDYNEVDDTKPSHYDNAVLLTRNGCIDGCGKEGFALQKLCAKESTAVVKDHGLMSAITASHELGHMFGLGHDGYQNDCEKAINVMAEEPAAGGKSEEWSKCSSENMAKKLRSSEAWCLKDVDKNPPKFDLYGKKYNRTRQCRFTFGPKLENCIQRQDHCEALFCSPLQNKLACTSLKLPVVDGTYCGPNHWCIHGACVPDGTTPSPPVDGGWSSWGRYVPCTRSCNIGDQWRERTCTNPEPQHGGKKCEGESKGFYRTCNTFKCKEKVIDPRETECKKKPGRNFNSFEFDARKPCMLICGINKKNNLIMGDVADGTHCDPYDTVNDLCINGKCTKVDCDLVLNSGAVHDRCGVCNGDGTTCEVYKGKDMNKYPQRGLHKIVTIPANSQKIVVQELGNTYLGFLGFKVGDSNNLAMRLPWLTPPSGQIYDLRGTKIQWISPSYVAADKIVVNGIIDTPIHIYYYNYYAAPSASKGIEWTYYGTSNGSNVVPTFKWVAKKWSECSSSCAGGTKTRKLICIRTDDKTQVNKNSCSNLEAMPAEEGCNLHDCPPEWHVTEWTPCSRTCGNGKQTRAVVCSMMTAIGLETVDDSKCSAPKLTTPTERQCNEKMCPAQWRILSEYSECSEKCGGGIKTREVGCQHINKDGQPKRTNPIECIKLDRPKDLEHCNEQPCVVKSR